MQPGFRFSDFYSAERVAYSMQYGPGSIRGAVLTPYAAAYSAYPTTTRIGVAGLSAYAGYGVYKLFDE